MLGVETAPSLPKSHGSFASPIFPWVYGRAGAASAPKTDDLQPRIIQIRYKGPLGLVAAKAQAVAQTLAISVVEARMQGEREELAR